MSNKTIDRHNAMWLALFLSWLIATVATFSALFLGEVLGRTPCVLCWYQRIAMFPLALLLGIACFVDDRSVWRYTLPLALLGGFIALWHSLLYVGWISAAIVPCNQTGPSCTSTDMLVVGVPLPYLSLLSFSSIILLLLPIVLQDRK